SAGSNGSTAVTGNQVVYTPAANFHGSDSFSYQVSDGQGGQRTATVTVTVRPVNDAPVTRPDSAGTTGATAVVIDVLANDSDPDQDPLTIASATAGSHGTTAVAGSRLVYTPASGYAGTDAFTYTVADGRGGTATGTGTVVVQAVGTAVTANPDSRSTSEDTAVVIDVLANDLGPAGAPLTLSGVGTPASGRAAGQGNQVAYTPAANWHGTETFMYQVADGRGGTGTGAVTVTVRPVNDAPTAGADSAVANEDGTVTVAVLANDTDPDGDALSVISATNGSNGTTLVASNRVIYYPHLNWSGTDSVTYQIRDSAGATATGTVTVTVRPVNDPPAAGTDSAVTDEGSPVTVDVLVNDTDPEANPLTLVSATSGAGGAVAVAGNRVVYTPNANWHGTDAFTYQIRDGQGGAATGTVTIVVRPVNDSPVAVADEATTNEDTAVTVEVLANDTDADRDALAVTSAANGSHGTARVAGNRVVYTPAANWNGSDSFSYQIADGQGGTATGTVAITVRPVNDPPVAASDTASTPQGQAVTVAVLANDTDPDNEPLTLASASNGRGGTARLDGDRAVYTPGPDFSGRDTFAYQVTDGHGGSATGTVEVTVQAANRRPLAQAAFVVDTAAPLLVHFDASTSRDPDGRLSGFLWNFGDGTQSTGAIVDHTYATGGQYQVRLTVTDNSGSAAEAVVPVTVTTPQGRQPPRPVIAIATGVTTVGTPVSVDGTGSSAPDGQIVTWAWDFGDGSTASGPTASHAYNAPGRYTITLTVRNDAGLMARAQAAVLVTEQAPDGERLAVSFQPAGSLVPEGFLADSGQTFEAERGYGWVAGQGPRTVIDLNRSNSPDQAYDTVAVLPATAVWEATVANGTYFVTACLMDPLKSAKPIGSQTVLAEGSAVVSGEPLGQSVRWIEKTGETTVTDGRLTLTFAGSSPVAVLAWVRLERTVPAEERLVARMAARLVEGDTAVHLEASDSLAPAAPILDYAWDFGDGSTGSGEVVEHEFPVAGFYTVILRLLDEGGQRSEARRTFWVPDGGQAGTLAVNFQPAAAAVPTGLMVDSGQAFADDRGYGWAPAGTGLQTLDFNKRQAPDQAHDTAILATAGSRWEVAVADGRYRVTISVVDPLQSPQTQGGQNVQAEDLPVVAQEPFGQGWRWVQEQAEVEVADGRLSLSFTGSQPLAVLCWLRLERLP
ncbi:MAG: Ig-like domain-containing protein, partial [Thermodesulfobacteriota bacterium]